MSFFEKSEALESRIDEVFSFAAERAENLRRVAFSARERIVSVLEAEFGKTKAEEISFHLADWNGDAAFMVALILYPERFTDEEVRWGIELLSIHLPAHAMAAATLLGKPLQDIW